MATIEFFDGFEFQTATTGVFNTGGRMQFSSVDNASVVAGGAHSGAAFLRLAPTAAAAGRVERPLAAGTRQVVVSFYIRFPSAFPAALCPVASMGGGTQAHIPNLVFDPATSQLALSWGGTSVSAVFGPTLVVDRWYLVDWKVDTSANPRTAAARIDGANEGTSSLAATASDRTLINLGSTRLTGPAATLEYDDYAYGFTLADYPYGPHHTVHLAPVADGGHVGGINTIENQAAADIRTPGFTTAFALVDDFPPTTTDFIRQATSGPSNYAEVLFEGAGDQTMQAITAWCAARGASGGTSDAIVRLIDETTGATVLDQGGAAAVTATAIRVSNRPIPGVSTGAQIRTLRARMGFASDVDPFPQFLAVSIEYLVFSEFSVVIRGRGSLSAGGVRFTTSAPIAVDGDGSLVVVGTRKRLGAASLQGVGILSAAVASHVFGRVGFAENDRYADPLLYGDEDVLYSGLVYQGFSGQGQLTAAGARRAFSSPITAVGSGALVATGIRVKQSGAIPLTSVGVLVATGSTQDTSVEMPGIGALSAVGSKHVQGIAALSATGLLVGFARQSVSASVMLSASGSMNVTGGARRQPRSEWVMRDRRAA